MTFLLGSTEKIAWTFDDTITTYTVRSWTFISIGSSKKKVLARIVGNGSASILASGSDPVIAVEKPATLVLKNVDRSYNGKYEFQVSATFVSRITVVVFVAGKFLLAPTV